jgi:hypothetical protein
VQRPKAGRGGQQHNINAAVDDLLVRIEADEAIFRLHIDLAGDVGIFLQRFETAFEPVGERITHRGKFDVGITAQGLRSRPGAAPTAADQADLEDIAAGCMDGQRGSGGSEGGGGFQEITAGGLHG